MRLFKTSLPVALALSFALASTAAVAAPVRDVKVSRRTTLMITYREGDSTSVDLRGSAWVPGTLGRADVKRKDGRTQVKVHLDPLVNPQTIGSAYTTYLVWAVAPEGQAASLAEVTPGKKVDLSLTTSFPTFGLLVTAEPHAAVSLPSPLVVAENTAREDTTGRFHAGQVEYSTATGALYLAPTREDVTRRDFHTPLPLLGARKAVDLARDEGAARYASAELQEAEARLAAVERARNSDKHPDIDGTAHEAMRLAEHARAVAVERRDAAMITAERQAASAQVAQAQDEADRAKDQAESAQAKAAREASRAAAARDEAALARSSAEAAKAQAGAAQVDAAVARQDAQLARQEAETARAQKEEAQQKLYQSLSAILETRREARGLIVSLSDVLFDFNQVTLTPAARERLSRLAGVLQAYPGTYRLGFEGHTDSVGTSEYNLGLSRGRAESARAYLLGAALPADRVGTSVGFGETRPVADNDTAVGRQMNRRVEIVIAGLDLP